jgi:hypothetical protein
MGEGGKGHYVNEVVMALQGQYREQHQFQSQLRALVQQCLSRELPHQRCDDERVAM